MADEEPPVREWEVVSLTASAYAAAPGGPEKNGMNDDENNDSAGVDDVAKTEDPLVMSGHFALPPSPGQPENKEIQSVHESECSVESGDFGCRSISDEGFKYEIKDQDDINIEGLDMMSDNISGIGTDDKGKLLSVGVSEKFEDVDGLPGLGLSSVDKEQSIYSSAELGSSIMSEITAVEESSVITAEVVEFENSELDSDSDSQNPIKKDYDDDAYSLPCGAWWKKKAGSVYAYAKEANTFWSVFVAATVMGLVILGQRWQQENWQIMQLKWQSSIKDEKIGKMFGPLTRLKDVLVGGSGRGSFIKGRSSSMDH